MDLQRSCTKESAFRKFEAQKCKLYPPNLEGTCCFEAALETCCFEVWQTFPLSRGGLSWHVSICKLLQTTTNHLEVHGKLCQLTCQKLQLMNHKTARIHHELQSVSWFMPIPTGKGYSGEETAAQKENTEVIPVERLHCHSECLPVQMHTMFVVIYVIRIVQTMVLSCSVFCRPSAHAVGLIPGIMGCGICSVALMI